MPDPTTADRLAGLRDDLAKRGFTPESAAKVYDDDAPVPVKPTTAARLVEYRDELLAAGFPDEQVAEMVCRAAANSGGFETQADRDRKARWSYEEAKASLAVAQMGLDIRMRLAKERAEPSGFSLFRKRWI
ncbi:hypothetical protein [Sphaerisporangium sp. TRM90804]|uniref:hypothetical protein n=1 Tax=Sphaerisporangium sp. TRM90804 TaxID=3031113 RepID=UPI002448D897|nr:hypothetical protein [Sphaerisporangium sp. TRM90804]MDH2424754.1 hypothetical protein [Sphaerisporangium sp. TRM90804]